MEEKSQKCFEKRENLDILTSIAKTESFTTVKHTLY